MGKSSGKVSAVLALWLLTFLVSTSPCFCAEPPSVMTLDQLIQMAIEKSPQLKEADQDIAGAQSDLNQAKAGRWPQFDATAILGPAEDAEEPIVVSQLTPSGQLIGRLKDRDHDGSIGIFGRLDFSIVQPVYTFGKISNRMDAAGYGVEAQRASKTKKQNDLIRDVKLLYYGFIVAEQGKGAADDAGTFVQDARKRIRKLIELNSKNADETDLYRLDAFEAEISQFKVKAESASVVTYEALKKTVGLPAGQEIRLDATELPKTVKPLDPLDVYIRQAMEQRPELNEIRKGLDAKQALVKAAQSDLYPSVFVAAIGSFAGAPGRDELDISYFNDDFNHTDFGGFLGTEWHFDFGIGKAKLDKAKAEYQKLLHTKEFAERNIPLEVTKYYQDAVEAQKSFEAFEKGAVASRRWIVASFSNFDIGIGVAKDMFEAIDHYGKNQGDYLRSLYNYHAALANLNYAIGEYQSGKP